MFSRIIVVIFTVVFGQGLVDSEVTIQKDCECGTSNKGKSARIVNGIMTEPHQYPWMSAMFSVEGNFHCGGAIISSRHILTAAHCVVYVNDPYSYLVKLGLHDKADASKLETYKLQEVVLDPKFHAYGDYDDYDLAVLTLDKEIVFSNTTKPICFADADADFTGKVGIIAGWGKTGNQTGSRYLQESRVKILPFKDCLEYEKKFQLKVKLNNDSMICGFAKGTDACQGDSGGPLFIETRPNKYAVFGAVSFGEGCAEDLPGIYTKLSPSLPWINEYIEKTGGSKCL